MDAAPEAGVRARRRDSVTGNARSPQCPSVRATLRSDVASGGAGIIPGRELSPRRSPASVVGNALSPHRLRARALSGRKVVLGNALSPHRLRARALSGRKVVLGNALSPHCLRGVRERGPALPSSKSPGVRGKALSPECPWWHRPRDGTQGAQRARVTVRGPHRGHQEVPGEGRAAIHPRETLLDDGEDCADPVDPRRRRRDCDGPRPGDVDA